MGLGDRGTMCRLTVSATLVVLAVLVVVILRRSLTLGAASLTRMSGRRH